MSVPLRALIVEDRPDDVELVLHELLRSGYAVERWTVDTPDAFAAALDAKPEVVLCDYSMAQFNAVQALALHRTKGCDAPFIVVTGSISEEVAVECMKQGAADYIIKDRLTRLGPAVGQALKIKAARGAQRRAEAAWQASEERFERAVRAARLGSWDWDLQSGEIVWSGGHAELFGLRPESFDGRYETFAQRVHPEDLGRVEQAIAQAREERTRYDQEYRVVWPDGTQRWIHGTGRFSYDSAGRPVRMAGVVQDITDRRRAEEAVHQKDTQLRQAQKMEAVGVLASGIAHDINNLLTVIYGAVALARESGSANPVLATSLDSIEDAAQQAAGVTKGLLAFARQAPPEKRTVDLCKVIEGAANFLKRMLPATIDLAVQQPEAGPLWVRADDTHLQQVVLNLAINARDAMPDGGSLRICVCAGGAADAGSSAIHDDGAGFAQLRVVDTGQGIPPDIIDRIFDPFFTTKPRGQGTGLGLAITHSIVQEHGGTLTVASTPGQGTTFTLTLPCVTPAAELQDEEMAAMVGSGRGELILVVEDYQPVREIIVGTLQARGYEVVAAADGVGALRGYERHKDRLQAMILDVDLPKRSGIDVLRDIRASGGEIPVIVLTGRVEAELEKSLDPHSTLLRKPFRVSDLVNRVGRQVRACQSDPTPT